MHAPGQRSSIRRRVLTVAGLVVAIAVVAVQAASGARSHTAHVDASSIDTAPANQPALDAAADDAESVAGAAYYTGSRVDDNANAVDVYLAHAPQSVIDQLRAMHPGTYVIDNDAAHPLSELLKVEHSLSFASLRTEGIDAVTAYPTSDGYLMVGVTSNNALQAAQSALDSLYGSSLIEVYGGAQGITLTGFRYNESTPWNGGDFISAIGTDRFLNVGWQENCTSGIPVHRTGSPTNKYMLLPAHCIWMFGTNSAPGIGTKENNGYRETDGSLFGGGGDMGQVVQSDDDSNGADSPYDAALVATNSGSDIFKSAWDSSEITSVAGTASNHVGDQGLCTSGAYDGAICGLVVQTVDVEGSGCVDGSNGTDCFTVFGNDAWNPNNANAIGASPGDSGGPVYTLNSSGQALARGMMDAGVNGSEVSCTSNPPPNYPKPAHCFHKLFFVGMADISADLNVSTNTN